MIIEILNNIAAEPGSIKKLEILTSHKDNELLKRVIYLALSKRIKFYIKQIPEYGAGQQPHVQLPEAVAELEKLYTRQLTGDAARSHLANLLTAVNDHDSQVLLKIIAKDLRINMGTSLINKVWPNLIEKTPYMGAKPFEEELVQKILADGPAESQIKMDGQYGNAIIRGGDVEMESRTGETYFLDGSQLVKELSTFSDCVLNGEFVIDGINRFQSNGIISSLITIGEKLSLGEDVTKHTKKLEKEKGMTYEEALNKLRYVVWDVITVDEYFAKKSSTPYRHRFSHLQSLRQERNLNTIRVVDSRLITTYAEAIDHFKEAIANGEEGTLVKSVNGGWKDDKPNWQVKMKLLINVDLKITSFNKGTGKNANVFSSINAESSDGLLTSSPTGLTEEMMKYITDNEADLIGKIVEIRCCGITPLKDGKHSLLHPAFVKIRTDKHEADSLEQIQAIENMAKGLATA